MFTSLPGYMWQFAFTLQNISFRLFLCRWGHIATITGLLKGQFSSSHSRVKGVLVKAFFFPCLLNAAVGVLTKRAHSQSIQRGNHSDTKHLTHRDLPHRDSIKLRPLSRQTSQHMAVECRWLSCVWNICVCHHRTLKQASRDRGVGVAANGVINV